MGNKLTAIITMTLLLSGCTNYDSSQADHIAQDCKACEEVKPDSNSTETTPVPAANSPTTETEKPKKLRRTKLVPAEQPTSSSNNTSLLESAPPTTAAPVLNKTASANWQPNEAHIFRGSELISGLKRDLGRQPSTTEMQNLLQTHMGLSSSQAQKLLVAVGNGY